MNREGFIKYGMMESRLHLEHSPGHGHVWATGCAALRR